MVMRKGTKRTIKTIVIVVIVAATVTGAILLVRHRKAALATAPRFQIAPLPIHTAPARTGTLERVREYLAVVEPALAATLSPRLTATIEGVHVQEGDKVAAEQLLVTLDGQEIRDSIASLEAQIDQMQAEWAANEATVSALAGSLEYWSRESERIAQLQAGGAATPSDVEAARERVNEITGRLESARLKSRALEHQATSFRRRLAESQTRLGYCSIVSPFDGVVSRREVDPGDLAVPGRALLTVEDQSRLKLAFDIPQQDVPQVRIGMGLSYTSPRGVQRQAAIRTLFPSLNHARMQRAETTLDGELANELVSGAYVSISLLLEREEGVTFVPTSAIAESPDRQPHVFVVEQGRLRAVPVRIIGHQKDETAVEGVEPGTRVVVSTFLGWSTLSSGLPAEVLE
jgi:RND family efflux transporter MFP subunit